MLLRLKFNCEEVSAPLQLTWNKMSGWIIKEELSALLLILKLALADLLAFTTFTQHLSEILS